MNDFPHSPKVSNLWKCPSKAAQTSLTQSHFKAKVRKQHFCNMSVWIHLLLRSHVSRNMFIYAGLVTPTSFPWSLRAKQGSVSGEEMARGTALQAGHHNLFASLESPPAPGITKTIPMPSRYPHPYTCKPHSVTVASPTWTEQLHIISPFSRRRVRCAHPGQQPCCPLFEPVEPGYPRQPTLIHFEALSPAMSGK